jgi:predicted transcriptional regulator
MTERKIISWIFLSIAMASESAPAGYRDISYIADGINHAVPTQNEMQNSIEWLLNRDLILKKSKFYTLTDLGKEIFLKAKSEGNNISEIWEILETKYIA